MPKITTKQTTKHTKTTKCKPKRARIENKTKTKTKPNKITKILTHAGYAL